MPEVVTVPTSTRVPWNRGRIVGPKPPLKPKHIWALRTRLQLATARETSPCSTLPSIASYAGVISSACA